MVSKRTKQGLKAYDGVLELFGTVGLASVTTITLAQNDFLGATPLDASGVVEFIKSHFVDSAGDISITNISVLVLSAVASFGDNFFLWMRK